MTRLNRSGNSKERKERHPLEGIPSVEFLDEIEKGKRRELRRRIASNFYRRQDVIWETAKRIIESGDLPADD